MESASGFFGQVSLNPQINKTYLEYKQELENRLLDHATIPNTYMPDSYWLNKPYSKNEMIIIVPGSRPIFDHKVPFANLLASRNCSDLLAQLFDHMSAEENYEAYDSALDVGIKNNNFETIKLIIDRKKQALSSAPILNKKIETSAISELINLYCSTFKVRTINIEKTLKLLLIHGARPDSIEDAPLHNLARASKDINHNTLEQIKKATQILIISGANCKLGFLFWPTPLQIAEESNPELHAHMLSVVTNRDALIEAIQRGENIPFTNIGDYSRFHMKDTNGYSLLYHALKTNNRTVAGRLISFFPELLNQRNFNGEFIWDDSQAAQNFVTMFIATNNITS
jgi:hypothetical protein